MAVRNVDELKRLVREALSSADFQASAVGLSGPSLTDAVARVLKKRHIGVTLLSVGPAESAALADYGVMWKSTTSGNHETNWFSLKPSKR